MFKGKRKEGKERRKTQREKRERESRKRERNKKKVRNKKVRSEFLAAAIETKHSAVCVSVKKARETKEKEIVPSLPLHSPTFLGKFIYFFFLLV